MGCADEDIGPSAPSSGSAVVVGGGIAGCFTALFLARAGVQVTVVDEGPGVAQSGGSRLNGGCLCPSLTLPWQHPSSLAHAARSVAAGDGAVAITWAAASDWRFLRWCTQLAASSASWSASHRASYALSAYSLQCMADVVSPADYRGGAAGSLQLFATEADLFRRRALIEPVVPGLQLLSALEVVEAEPALATPSRLGLLSATDSSGDVRLCALAVKRQCLQRGVRFIHGRRVTRLETNVAVSAEYARADPPLAAASPSTLVSSAPLRKGVFVFGARLDDGELLCANQFVVAAGIQSEKLMEDAGDGRAAWPVHGYVLEVPLNNMNAAVSGEEADELQLKQQHGSLSKGRPQLLRMNVVDDVGKVYASPMCASAAAGRPESVRLSGVCELRGVSEGAAGSEASEAAFAALLGAARGFFPDGYLVPDEHRGIVRHQCVRPQTPDDLPVIGPSSTHANLFYCSGHGHLGWTRAAGSARLLADIMTGSEPALDPAPFSPARFAPTHVRAQAWLRLLVPGIYLPS